MADNHDDSDSDRLADVLEKHITDENAEYDPEEVYGRVGTGKTTRLARHARHRADDAESVEFIDPKGEGGES